VNRSAVPRTILFVALACLVMPLASVPARAADDAMADSSAMDWSRVPEYRLVPGDELILNFGPPIEADAPGTGVTRGQRIRPDGRISVFPVGDVVAAGRTVSELEAELVKLLGAALKRPRVTIEVAEVAGNEVHVIGRVENAGSYKAGPYLTVSQAIAKAGGFKDDAATNSVLVFHRDGARTARVMRLRLGDALKRGRLEADLPLGRFDIVYVPRSAIGNLNLFTKQFFGENIQLLYFGLVGWELFHLDRVFVIPPQ
jgi:protein involved in polysaccharide export with SLBB domain